MGDLLKREKTSFLQEFLTYIQILRKFIPGGNQDKKLMKLYQNEGDYDKHPHKYRNH